MRLTSIFCCAALLSTGALEYPAAQSPRDATPSRGSAIGAPARGPAEAPAIDETTASQVMLDRAGFSPGEIDGRLGPNTRRALAAFQHTHALQSSGQLDPATSQKLAEQMGALPPLVTYTITADDVKGPFTPGVPEDMMQKAKLEALGYTSALEMLAERFHVSPLLLRQFNRGATFTREGEAIWVPNVEVAEMPMPPQPARGRRGAAQPIGTTGGPSVTIYVTKATSALTVEDAAGRVLFHAPVTSGSERDPLPIGQWKVTRVYPMPTFNYNPALFWDADPQHAKARIAPGPNNPVGTVWIDLTKEHYGLHGTPEPSRIGHTQSHGCVRLTNWDIQRVARWAAPGTPVIFR